jgi:hypothetical protein
VIGLVGDWIMWGNFHRDRNNDLKTDALGRVTIPALIPGALYQITSNEAKFDMRQGLSKNEFRVRAGETTARFRDRSMSPRRITAMKRQPTARDRPTLVMWAPA